MKISFLIVGLFITTSAIQYSEAQIGVAFNATQEGAPPPEEIITLLIQNNVTRIRIYEPDQATLTALKGKNIEVILGIPNKEIIPMSKDPKIADLWIQTNVVPFLPDVKITYIIAGNEISPINNNNGFSFFLVDALKNLNTSIVTANLMGKIKLSVVLDMSIVVNAFPPSNASFTTQRQEAFVVPVLDMVASHNASLLVNIYPYFPHVTNLKDVKVEQALFTAPTNFVTDGTIGYQNLFDAMLDSFYSALDKLRHGNMDIIVSETGWPTAGGVSATVDNAKIYYTNLVQHVKKGTPKRPNKPIETYIYTMFDDTQVDGPEIDRHWGILLPNKQGKFPLLFN